MKMRKLPIIGVVMLCFGANTLLAEVISGSWMGTLELGIAKLRLVVHIAQDGSCSLDSPDQGANGIPASIVSRTEDSLEIKVPSIGASYSGRLKNGVLQGTFVQRGMKFPLEQKSGVSTDPQSDIRNITCPTLILNGEKDGQVVASQNLAAFRRNLPSHSMNIVKCYPNLNHLFQHCQTGLPAEYGEIEETFSEEVLNDIADWLLKA